MPARRPAPVHRSDAAVRRACGAAVDDGLAQIARHADGLARGPGSDAGDDRVEHVHQLRVGLRRLRCALRCFRGWVPAPPAELVQGLRVLFTALGRSRDRDVLAASLSPALAAAGAPPLALAWRDDEEPPDPAALVASPATQALLQRWAAWRAALETPCAPDRPRPARRATAAWRRRAARRLRRWHARIAAEAANVDRLDDAALHALRQRVKRQRYALEFFAPLLRRRRAAAYLQALIALQAQLGALNDLFVARDRVRTRAAPSPAAWFALGWLAARIDAERALVGPALARLAATRPPPPRALRRRPFSPAAGSW